MIIDPEHKIYNCQTCALRAYCKLAETGQETDGCGYWTDELITCDFCGQPILKPILFYKEYILCQHCFHKLDTCNNCQNSSQCAFMEDRTLPKQIKETSRQGNMVMQTMVKNPALIEKTCKQGCACWDGEDCYRDYIDYCDNIKRNID